MPLFGRRQAKRAWGKMNEEMLLVANRSSGASVHPRWWMLLGAVYVVLGLTLIIMAGCWLWLLGCMFGIGILKLGTTLIGIGVSGEFSASLT